MPRRPVLTVIERQELLALPTDAVQRVQHFTLTDSDLAIIRQRRGEGNRLGFAPPTLLPPIPRPCSRGG
jgi:hypothetical protein